MGHAGARNALSNRLGHAWGIEPFTERPRQAISPAKLDCVSIPVGFREGVVAGGSTGCNWARTGLICYHHQAQQV